MKKIKKMTKEMAVFLALLNRMENRPNLHNIRFDLLGYNCLYSKL